MRFRHITYRRIRSNRFRSAQHIAPVRTPGERLAAEVEAFVQGQLAALREDGPQQPRAAWLFVNGLAHGSFIDLSRRAWDAERSAVGGGRPTAVRPTWEEAERWLAASLLAAGADPDGVRRIQQQVLVPLELELIERSTHAALAIDDVITETAEALDVLPLGS